MSPIHRGVIFTNHAWQRLDDRTISADMVVETISYPEKRFASGQSGTKFIRTLRGRKVHVVAEKNRDSQWVVISTWVRGENDKIPLAWQLITAPFRLLWWILQQLWRTIFGKPKK